MRIALIALLAAVLGTAPTGKPAAGTALDGSLSLSGAWAIYPTAVAWAETFQKINPKVRIAATRKTTPGFREFEKKAVLIGGGDPHRYALDDAILIKDNHIMLVGGVEEALKRARRGSFTKKIEIEVENPKDARTALANGADIIMLDNFKPKALQKLSEELKSIRPDVMIEASGGISPKNVRKFAPGADIISLGWLTHSVKSIDFSMDVKRT